MGDELEKYYEEDYDKKDEELEEKYEKYLLSLKANAIYPGENDEDKAEIGVFHLVKRGRKRVLRIPNGTEIIDKDFFQNFHNIKTIYIPKTVKKIDPEAFFELYCLEKIVVHKDNPCFDNRNDCNAIIETKTNKLIVGSNNTIIPEGVVTIEKFAFYYCESLKSIYIPKTVKRIKKDAFFCSCFTVESIIVDKDNPYYDSRNNCNAIIETKTNNLLIGCKNTIIPEDVLSIGSNSFCCVPLTKIYIPKNVLFIGKRVFLACFYLNEISVDKDNPNYDSRNNCNAIIETKTNKLICSSASTFIPESVTSFDEWAFRESPIKNLIIPNTIKKLPSGTFFCCNYLESIKLPDDIAAIPNYFFKFCNKLKSIEIPKNVKSIGISAFESCTNLKNVNFNDNLESIRKKAFIGCNKLKFIKLPNNLKSVGPIAFACCKNLEDVKINKKNTYVAKDAFEFCEKLKMK